MYLATAAPARFGSLGTCDPDLATAATDAARLERINRAIECELRLEFPTSTHPGLIERRRRLRGLVRAVPAALASALQRELEQNVTTLARLFWTRLHSATSKELLSILCQTFFKEYELRFNPVPDTFSVPTNAAMSAPDRAERIADVMSLVGDVANNAPGLLWSRLLKRADAALDGVGLVPASLPQPGTATPLREAVRRLSESQLALFRSSFPDGGGGIDFTAFQACFERFANGELRDPSLPGHVGFGEPNGGNYFLFAEFAFLCVELKQDETEWARALRTFVKTQEIFMHIYREKAPASPPPVGLPPPTSGPERRDLPPPAKASDPGFDFSFFRSIGGAITVGRGQSDFRRKMALRAKYDALDVAGLERAARDNLQRAVRMP